jgi:pimeloyl-ACP methyl ester carboxylesterase
MIPLSFLALVGVQTFVWTDETRGEALTDDPTDHRTISASVFYPAKPGTGARRAYLPDFDLWMRDVGEARLRVSLGAAFDAARSATTETRTNAAVAKGRFPLLIFLPGLGMNVGVYESLLWGMASHGYVVLAINPTYEVFAATLADGKAVGFSSPGWFRTPVENILRYERERMAVWAVDAVMAMERLSHVRELDRRIDWRKIGALGHSAGARVAARLCQNIPTVSACMNLDGFAGFEPFFAEPGRAFEKGFAMIHMPMMEPTNPEMVQERDRQRAAGIRVFESVRKGSWEVTLNTPGMQHGSFTDLPLLGKAPGDQARAMMLIQAYTREFFDGVFGRKVKPMAPQPEVRVDRYTFRGPIAIP